jgi:hypothetical protein
MGLTKEPTFVHDGAGGICGLAGTEVLTTNMNRPS